MNPRSTVSLLSFLFFMSPNLSLPKSDNLFQLRSTSPYFCAHPFVVELISLKQLSYQGRILSFFKRAFS